MEMYTRIPFDDEISIGVNEIFGGEIPDDMLPTRTIVLTDEECNTELEFAVRQMKVDDK